MTAIVTATSCQGVYTRAKLRAVQDDRVVGEWINDKESDETFTIRREGEDYVAQPAKKDEPPVPFRLVKAGNTLWVQYGGNDPCDTFQSKAPCYGLARLAITPTGARAWEFDTQAMFQALVSDPLGISYEMRRRVRLRQNGSPDIDTDFLLTGDDAQIRAFLAKYGERFTGGTPFRYRKRAPQ